MARIRSLHEKPVHWVGSAREDLLLFPEAVVDDFGYALGVVQQGGSPPSAKPWKGEGAGIFELVQESFGRAYRVAYTVRFEAAIYVLHCFQKKSPTGVRTSKRDVEMIARRLRAARADYEVRYAKKR